MTATATAQLPKNVAFSSVMHVRLLGFPKSGKSALYSALEQEAAANACLLRGDVEDLFSDSVANEDSDADVVLLAVDVGALVENAESYLEHAGCFLNRLTEERSQRSTVAGLPVFVVLTKCDLLLHAGVTLQSWLDCIEHHKLSVAAKLRDYLRKPTDGPWPFGSVDVLVWATSIDRPNLGDVLTALSEPFGVSELFRQARESVDRHRRRRRRTQRLLLWMVVGTFGSLLGLVALAIALIAFRPSLNVGSLAANVGIYRLLYENQTSAERLRAPLAPTIRRLAHIRDDPNFNGLAPADRDFIDDRLDELDAYVTYKDRLETVNISAVDTEADLTHIQQQLKTALQPPLAYADEWLNTDAVLLRGNLSNDLAALRDGISGSRDWFDEQLKQARELQTFTNRTPTDETTWKDWDRQATEVLSASFPHPETDSLPGSDNLKYSSALRFEPVADARDALNSSKIRLNKLHELVSALGLVGQAPDGNHPPLNIPKSFSLEEARAWWRRLETQYPTIVNGTDALEIPDAIASQVRRAAKTSYGHLLEVGRDIIQRRLALQSPSGESLDTWRGLLPWLANSEELRDWRQLAVAILRINNPTAQDPVLELSDFIRRDRFDLDLRQATLEMPLQENLRPAGALTIYKGPNERNATPVLSMQVTDEKNGADRRVTSFSLLPSANSSMSFKPGEFLFARMPVKRNDDDREWVLTWARRRSEVFPFECLSLPPRLHRLDQPNTEGELLENIRFGTTPENGIPKVPDLVPIVKPK